MSAFEHVAPRTSAPLVLVVDDDRRVVELLEIALLSHGFAMISASDGDEALRRVQIDRPDLMVLDVRLPRRSGLEVCERMRRDPELAGIPVVLVSAAAETDSRLQGFGHGADDFLAKPFSPKELIARLRRLHARSSATIEAERRGLALERELRRVQEESRRAHLDAGRERRQRELVMTLGPELHAIADLDALAARIAAAAQPRLGSGFVAVLASAPVPAPLVARAWRGDGPERTALLALVRGRPLAVLLASLERPVSRGRLEAFEEVRDELSPFVAAGVSLFVPLVGPAGLEGLMVSEERLDGAAIPIGEVDTFAAFGRVAGSALANARATRLRADAALAALAEGGPSPEAGHAAALAGRAAAALLLTPMEREEAALAAAIGAAAPRMLEERFAAAAIHDPSGRVARVRARLEAALAPHAPGEETATTLVRATLALATGTGSPGTPGDPAVAEALAAAWRDLEAGASAP